MKTLYLAAATIIATTAVAAPSEKTFDRTLTTSATPNVSVNTGSGNVQLHPGSGDVRIEDVGASLKASSGSGNVIAHGIHGTANLDTGSGDIQLDEAATGDVRAQTGSGNIHLNGVAGGLTAGTGSGNIDISGNPTADWKLQTGSGDIRLNLGHNARFTLNATTGSGTVHTDQPLTIQGFLDKHHITGTVNGGGPTLRAGTGSGDIEIR